ncbi:MAG TPA: alpha/beta fold hydrolase [Candidatus Limnocylindrales bacterium]
MTEAYSQADLQAVPQAAQQAAQQAFSQQQPAWSVSDFDPRVEVATIEVPLSYTDPGGERIELAISRIRCTDPSRRRGILLSLNGGPGANWGKGIRLPLRFANTPLAEHYDLIGFDPRGTGLSTPLYREDTRPLAGFNTRPGDEDFAAITEDSRRMYEGCARHGGALREQITSANTARDIDILRRILGEEKLSCVGYGGPSYNFMVYGTMFPDHMDRMVLDSARHPDTGWRGVFHAQVPAIYDNVHAWAEWVAEHHTHFGLGTTQSEVLAATERAAFLTDTTTFDVGMGIGTRHRPLWAVTAEAVAALAVNGGFDGSFNGVGGGGLGRGDGFGGGDAHEVFRKLAGLDAWALGEPQELVQCVTEAATCEDDWPTDLEVYYADMRVARDKYPYGYGVSRFQPWVGTFWTDRNMERPPEIRREGYGQGVVVHGVGNTQLAYSDGEATAKRLGFSLITVADEGHTEIFANRGNQAVDEYVLRYLIDGTLPPERVTVPGPARPDLNARTGTAAEQLDAWIAANVAW